MFACMYVYVCMNEYILCMHECVCKYVYMCVGVASVERHQLFVALLHKQQLAGYERISRIRFGRPVLGTPYRDQP